MATVEIKISGDKQAIDKLKRFSSGLLDMTDAMKSIGKEMASYYGGEVFSSEGLVFGATWPTNKTSTIKQKIKKYPKFSTSTLIRTGEMKNSFEYDADKNSVTITNTAPYFKYHQSSLPRTKMPYRPMMGINEPIKNMIKSIIKQDISDKIARLT